MIPSLSHRLIRLLVPNNSYERSTRRERELVKAYRLRGWHVCRSAGSHSPWDVWAYNPLTGDVNLIQVKTKRGGRSIKIKNKTTDYGKIIDTWTQSYE